MKKWIVFFLTVLAISLSNGQSDPYMWLEEVEGDSALAFVAEQNSRTMARLSKQPYYEDIYAASLKIYNSKQKIPYPDIYREHVYNFWKDENHERGIWRRTTLQSYAMTQPVWETLLDFDELSKKDHRNWVFQGATVLYPSCDLFLIYLSDGGSDASFIKEFDVKKKAFVDRGFNIGESLTEAYYLDQNTLLVSSNIGKNSITASGYPNQVRIWKRGKPFEEAQIIFQGDTTDVASKGYIRRDQGNNYVLIDQDISTYVTHSFVWFENKLTPLNIPDNHGIPAIVSGQLILHLLEDWQNDETSYKQGSLLSLNLPALLNGKTEIQVVVQPDEVTSVYDVSSTQDHLLVNLLSNVKNELYIYTFSAGKWVREKVEAPDFGTLELVSTEELSNNYFFEFENFLTPTTLFASDAQTNTISRCKSLPAFFKGENYLVEQHHAISKDGTLIPYFLVSPRDMEFNGRNPTLLNAYGGFGLSEVPFYSGVMGKVWLERGGIFVLANIRGGGEFGPEWHHAGFMENKQNSYDDFHAVAEDLIKRKVTSNKRLGIMGGSNAGLLVGVAFTQRPDLYHAVISIAALLDMKRYSHLGAGASWIGEYGNPDKPEEWEFIKKYSPYHNLKSGMSYPEVFFYASATDDRVHPGHARKMTAKMIDLGFPVLYYENMEGGHYGSATNEQRARAAALEYSYLLMRLKD